MIYFVVAIIIFLICCNSKNSNSLNGEWIVVNYQGTYDELYIGTIFKYLDSNCLITEKNGFQNIGVYSTINDTLYNFFGNITIRYVFRIVDNRLYLTIVNSKEQLILNKINK